MTYHEFRTAVIGVGSMGQNHARIYSEISNLVAVVDTNESQGREVADRFSVDWYRDYRDILDKVDAVSVSVPTSFHRKVAEAFSSAGVHLLIEKPLAGNSLDASAIVEACKKGGVKLAVGHVERHNPVVTYAKNAITKGEWGKIITLSSRRVSSFPSRIRDVGVLFDLTLHDIDISNYLAGSNINSVYAVGGRMMAEHEDYVNIILEHKSGVISICETNWLTPMKIRKLGITTSSHYVELDYQSQSIKLFNSRYVEVNEKNLYSSGLEFESKDLQIEKKEPLLLEISDFLSAIKNDTKPLVTGEEGCTIVKISETALSSLNQKKHLRIID